ncbi:DUF413 domain-containing protein [Alteromonas oceanisediminis]|uniref:DUF413 domain-containing protein n=1 Tax=Alteromonas oceanisediminis TaxID=2836180 RepID=UPI001BD96081|nr:DUF413 domain-containing protein [Alteromonas oceanisediminis]MBT0586049.1 DUF413 domain-containing protein [Alteromonas oceanisediminis]
MANVTRLDLLKRMFSDPKNYPYGFSRSGDFSISESKALSQYGCLIAALVDGKLPAETDEDKAILAAAYGNAEPQSTAERAWVKYQKRINRPKMGNIYGSRPLRETSSSRDEMDDVEDSDIVIDDA